MNPTSDPKMDTQELLRLHPSYFDGMLYTERSFKKPCNLTFVFSTPRSGSTLLMRLINMACLTPMVGDRPPEFYDGIIKTYQGLMKGGQYGQLLVAEDKGEFWDEFRGSSLLRVRYLFKYAAGLLFGVDAHRSGACKTTILGFGNEMVKPMCDMLHDLYDNDKDYNLRIVFLTRDTNAIVRSFQKRKGPGQETAIQFPERIIAIIEKQKQQFNDAWEIGDACFTYGDLVNDTARCLRACLPLHDPNLKAMESILKKVIR